MRGPTLEEIKEFDAHKINTQIKLSYAGVLLGVFGSLLSIMAICIAVFGG